MSYFMVPLFYYIYMFSLNKYSLYGAVAWFSFSLVTKDLLYFFCGAYDFFHRHPRPLRTRTPPAPKS